MIAGHVSGCSETGRLFDEIARTHHLDVEEFAGKTILDLGCGSSPLLRDLQFRGIAATVIGIDISDSQLEAARARGQTNLIKANLAEPLPLLSESVDIALATYSFPFWAPSPDIVYGFYREAMRTLKPGGVLSLYPNNISADMPFEPGTSIVDIVRARTRAADDLTAELVNSDTWNVIDTGVDSLLQIRRHI